MLKVYAIDGITPVVDPAAYVYPSAILIGDVIVGPRCYIGPGACLRGDFGRIVLHDAANPLVTVDTDRKRMPPILSYPSTNQIVGSERSAFYRGRSVAQQRTLRSGKT